jgi:DNA-binding MarR family transcriptional regulator
MASTDLRGFPPPQLHVIDAVFAAARQLRVSLDREVGALGLSWAQARVLLELAEGNGLIHAGAVGRQLGVSRQAAHQLMAKLDAKGYLEWQDDVWIKSARLTTAGAAGARAAEEAATGTLDAVWRVDAHVLWTALDGVRSIAREVRRGEPEPAWWLD